MAIRLQLDQYSHGVRASGFTSEMARHLDQFCDRLCLKEMVNQPRGGMVMEIKKQFFGKRADGTEYFFHRHHLKDLLAFLRNQNYDDSHFNIISHAPPKAHASFFEIKDHISPRDYQVTIVNQLANDDHTTGLKLFTGYGKSLSALMATARRGHRVIIMIPPKYFGIWKQEFEKSFKNMGPESGRLRTVTGTAELRRLQHDALDGNPIEDVILMSNVTYRTYIEAYERFGMGLTEIGYVCAPYQFHELCGIGVQINDEIQDDPGLVFRIDLYTNVQKQMYLTATPYTGSDYVTKMIDVMTPPEYDCELPEYKVYINTVALIYGDSDVQPKDYTSPYKNTYSHARYESRMLQKKKRLAKYLKMIGDVVESSYVKHREEGQKMLLLFATVDFIKEATAYLQDRFTDLEVGYHVSGSDYNKLLTRDITCSTIKSSGTGVDIPNLKETLLAHSVDSKKDNIQVLGRLRPPKDFPDITPRLTFLVCSHIPAQIRYARNKENHFRGRVLNARSIRYN